MHPTLLETTTGFCVLFILEYPFLCLRVLLLRAVIGSFIFLMALLSIRL